MMLFKPKHVPMILNGTKTQTRRIWRVNRANVGSIHQARTELFGKPFAYLKITKRFAQELGDISEKDVIKEGYKTITDFYDVWVEINGSWFDQQPVEVVEFVVINRRNEKNG